MLGNFSCFYCRLLTFQKLTFLKDSFRNTIRGSNSLDPDQDRRSVCPYLGPNCLLRLSVDEKIAASKSKVGCHYFNFSQTLVTQLKWLVSSSHTGNQNLHGLQVSLVSLKFFIRDDLNSCRFSLKIAKKNQQKTFFLLFHSFNIPILFITQGGY